MTAAKIRKGVGYAVLASGNIRIGLRKAVGFAVLESGYRGAASNTLGTLTSAASGNHIPASTGTATNTLGSVTQEAVGEVSQGATGTASNTLASVTQDATGYTSPLQIQKAVGYAALDSASDVIGLQKAAGYAVTNSASFYADDQIFGAIGLQKGVGFAVLDDRVALWLSKAVGYAVLDLGPVEGSGSGVLGDLVSAASGTVVWPNARVRVEHLSASTARTVSLYGSVTSTASGGQGFVEVICLNASLGRTLRLQATWVPK